MDQGKKVALRVRGAAAVVFLAGLAGAEQRAQAWVPASSGKVAAEYIGGLEYACAHGVGSNQIFCASSQNNWVNGWTGSAAVAGDSCGYIQTGLRIAYDPSVPIPKVFAIAHCLSDSKKWVIGCYINEDGTVPFCDKLFTAPGAGVVLGPHLAASYSPADSELAIWTTVANGASAGHLYLHTRSGGGIATTDVSAAIAGAPTFLPYAPIDGAESVQGTLGKANIAALPYDDTHMGVVFYHGGQWRLRQSSAIPNTFNANNIIGETVNIGAVHQEGANPDFWGDWITTVGLDGHLWDLKFMYCSNACAAPPYYVNQTWVDHGNVDIRVGDYITDSVGSSYYIDNGDYIRTVYVRAYNSIQTVFYGYYRDFKNSDGSNHSAWVDMTSGGIWNGNDIFYGGTSALTVGTAAGDQHAFSACWDNGAAAYKVCEFDRNAPAWIFRL